jgi:hypothetical protein
MIAFRSEQVCACTPARCVSGAEAGPSESPVRALARELRRRVAPSPTSSRARLRTERSRGAPCTHRSAPTPTLHQVLVGEKGLVTLTRRLQGPPPRGLAVAATRGLLWYLERSIGSRIVWLYPTAPQRADAWLQVRVESAAQLT